MMTNDVIVMMKEMMMMVAVAVFILLILRHHHFHCDSEQICQLIFSVTKTLNRNPPTQRENVNGLMSKLPRLLKPTRPFLVNFVAVFLGPQAARPRRLTIDRGRLMMTLWTDWLIAGFSPERCCSAAVEGLDLEV